MKQKNISLPLVSTQIVAVGEVTYYTSRATKINDVIGLIDKIVKEKLDDSGVEHFGIIGVNKDNIIIGIALLSKGNDKLTSASPRDVVKYALMMNATAVFLFHNHPKDTAAPSKIDIEITQRIAQVCGQLGIDVLDHYIFGTDKTISMYRETYID